MDVKRTQRELFMPSPQGRPMFEAMDALTQMRTQHNVCIYQHTTWCPMKELVCVKM